MYITLCREINIVARTKGKYYIETRSRYQIELNYLTVFVQNRDDLIEFLTGVLGMNSIEASEEISNAERFTTIAGYIPGVRPTYQTVPIDEETEAAIAVYLTRKYHSDCYPEEYLRHMDDLIANAKIPANVMQLVQWQITYNDWLSDIIHKSAEPETNAVELNNE